MDELTEKWLVDGERRRVLDKWENKWVGARKRRIVGKGMGEEEEEGSMLERWERRRVLDKWENK